MSDVNNGQSSPVGGQPGDMPPAAGIPVHSPALDETINVPTITFADASDGSDTEGSAVVVVPPSTIYSELVSTYSITAAELMELSAGEGAMLYYPPAVDMQIGDVFYLREREQGENGLMVQVIRKETASYPQVESKVLWRLLVAVRAQQLQRTQHEPAEVIDQFLSARFKVRASIVNGEWRGSEGRVVTRNVDIFPIDPELLTRNIFNSQPPVNVDLGNFRGAPVAFSGEGFDKINLITGMKGAGKSHITKGIIDQSRQRGMTSVVFDINNEYGRLPGAVAFTPGRNLKFRLDRISTQSFVEIIERLAPFAERTSFAARAAIPRVIQDRIAAGYCPDIAFLRGQANAIFPQGVAFMDSMRASYMQSLGILDRYELFATEDEARAEDAAARAGGGGNAVHVSLTSTFYEMDQRNEPGVVVFNIGGLLPSVQLSVVRLILDTLESICNRQHQFHERNPEHIPVYPTVYFEEAHMYMDPADINVLIPLIRHLGMNLFFITNTPCELPDSVFRLLDNLFLTRMLNERDIKQVATCGLTDRETIEGFAPQLPEYHALLLSGKDRITRGFPLVFQVRDFGLPASGETRSMWRKLGESRSEQQSTDEHDTDAHLAGPDGQG